MYLVTGYTDLRLGIDGLAALVQGKLELDPYSRALFLFCGRRRDRIKSLIWEGDGFLLLYKRLDNGCCRWPRNEDEQVSGDDFTGFGIIDGKRIASPVNLHSITGLVMNPHRCFGDSCPCTVLVSELRSHVRLLAEGFAF